MEYSHDPVTDGDRVRIGDLDVQLVETPGHSPDSLSFLVYEDNRPRAIFTGDLLFVNDVGRPDLRDAHEDPTALASKLYDSLHSKILGLPDDVRIYPAHGAGSLCGRAISSAEFSTVGQERQSNWALQIADREEFVRQMTANLPDRPAYFAFDVGVNLQGASPMSNLKPLAPLGEINFAAAVAQGATVIDTRPAAFFGAGHYPGSLNIGLGSALFSTWVGFMVPGDKPIALVVGSPEMAIKARLELARIGFDNVIGYVDADSLSRFQQLSQLSVCDLKKSLRQGSAPLVLDVRTPGEWEKQHIDQARHIPLPTLKDRLGEVPRSQPIAVVCGSGYRSSIAASLLRSQGFQDVQNVMGGMSAYAEADCPAFDPPGLVFQSVSESA